MAKTIKGIAWLIQFKSPETGLDSDVSCISCSIVTKTPISLFLPLGPLYLASSSRSALWTYTNSDTLHCYDHKIIAKEMAAE